MRPPLRWGGMQPGEVGAQPVDRLAERRQALRRLRWRMRGAWQWPTFFALTLLDAAVLTVLPFYGDGPGGFLPALLMSGFANLAAVAVLAPLCGRLLRRRRPDLPRLVAANYAGTALVALLAVAVLAGGVLHRPAVAAEESDRRAVVDSVHVFVATQAPGLRERLGSTDVMRVDEGLYRACVPKPQPRRWLCLFVSTDQAPPGITRDRDENPNAMYRLHGGFR